MNGLVSYSGSSEEEESDGEPHKTNSLTSAELLETCRKSHFVSELRKCNLKGIHCKPESTTSKLSSSSLKESLQRNKEGEDREAVSSNVFDMVNDPEDVTSAVARSAPKVMQELYVQDRKRKNKESDASQPLDIPLCVKKMFGDCRQTPVDDPALHQNRIRSFPHEQGNWATHVYIPVNSNEDLVRFVHNLTHFLSPGGFEIMPEFHVSLSRTVAIRHHWIEPLVKSLRDALTKLPESVCEIIGVSLYTNDEKTRTFLCLELSVEDTELLSYVASVDKCFLDFKLAQYYQNPSFHTSVAWCLGDATNSICGEKLSNAKEMLTQFVSTHPDLGFVYAQQVHCRSGNKTFAISLKKSFSAG